MPRGEVVRAVSCARTDVQNAIEAAANGDTVQVPAGTCTWSSNISIVDKSVAVLGAGAGSTVINGGGAFSLTNSASRISGFTFELGSSGSFLVVASIGWRVDHNTITRGTYDTWMTTYGVRTTPSEGLIDNNHIISGRIVHYGEDSSTTGRHVWSRPLDMATSRAIYVEDNVIDFPDGSGGGSLNFLDGNWGCRYVGRFNTISGTRFEAHSVQGQNQRACMLWEIYKNTMTNPESPSYRPLLMRGGTGVIFHNTSDGRFTNNAIFLDNVRSHQFGTGTWGMCDGTSFVDGNTSGGEGYPCRDQIGRAADGWVWDYASPAPVQAHTPAYIWRNTQPSGEVPTRINCVGTESQCNRQATKHIVESRDYYTYRASFDGTGGVGEGTLASRPGTCVPGAGYWATDQGEWNDRNPGADGQLYTCRADGVWALHYRPFAYPHPLQAARW